jgi:hypothetical protein
MTLRFDTSFDDMLAELSLHSNLGGSVTIRRILYFLGLFVPTYLGYWVVDRMIDGKPDPQVWLEGLAVAGLVAGIAFLKKSREVDHRMRAILYDPLWGEASQPTECGVGNGLLRYKRGNREEVRPIADIKEVAMRKGRLTLLFQNGDFLALPPQAFHTLSQRADFIRQIGG